MLLLVESRIVILRQWKSNTLKVLCTKPSSFIFSSFITILDSCLEQLSLTRPNISQQPLYIPFRPDKPIDYEPIQWQVDTSVPSRFIVQPPSPSQILQPRNEPNNENNTNVVPLDDIDDHNYVDAIGDEENEPPKTIVKKKVKKKKQQVNPVVVNNDASIQLNTSSNRVSSAGHKFVNTF